MRLNELYATYKDQFQFYIVYIKEAHAHDGWRVPNNLIEDIIYDEPTTDDERTEVASACQIDLDLHMPMLVGGIGNDVDNKYVGLPMRLFLIDKDDKVAYAGKKGPFGWDDEEFEETLKKVIA
ncbi:MAG: hypothetical protein QGF09_03505 [Rhodospirillales bacterium]|nr:hypothetical protein [Rhodospirillales bacterium]